MESTPSCSHDPTDITADARASGLRTNEVRTGSAEGGLKIFRYRICDNPSGAQGVRWIATLFLEDKERRRQYCLRQSGDADRATSIRRSYVSSIVHQWVYVCRDVTCTEFP